MPPARASSRERTPIMRARLVALLVVGFLLAPLPVLAAAPERAGTDSSSWMEGWFSRLAGPVLNLFGTSEQDLGPSVDPNGLTPPAQPAPAEGDDDGDLGPGVDPDG